MLRKLRLASLVVFGLATCSGLLAQKVIRVPSLSGAATIQGGIDIANDGDTVLVGAQPLNAPYMENIDFKGKAITVSAVAAGIVIDGSSGTGPTVTFANGETRAATLQGFTITGGSNGAGSYGSPDGGIYVFKASPTIIGNDITANHAHGIRVTEGAPLIQNNTIEGTLSDSNTPLQAGAGIYIEEFTPGCAVLPNGSTTTCAAILNNTISTNTGGGIAIDQTSDVFIEQNIIHDNTRQADGAGISFVNAEDINIVDNVIYNNSTTTGGTGGVSLQLLPGTPNGFAAIVTNNTIANNTTSAPSNLTGSQLNFGSHGSAALAVNNMLVGSSAASPVVSCGAVVAGDTPASFDHNDIYNSASGGATNAGCDIPAGLYGSISVNPAFTSAATGNFASSAGIDKGNTSTPLLLTTDINGAEVPQDGTSVGYGIVDIGAYESTGAPFVHISQGTLTVTPSAYVQTSTPITLTAKMVSATDTPSGLVDFYIDNVLTKSVALDANGNATLTTTDVPNGTHAVLAVYPTSATNSNTPTQSVKFYIQINTVVPGVATTTTVASSMNPSGFGAPIVFTATVTAATGTAAPAGSITFTTGATALGTVLLTPGSGNSSTAQIPNNTLAVGNHPITATYIPGGNFTANTGTLTGGQTITPVKAVTLTETAAPSPSGVGQSVTFTATVKSKTAADGTPTGAVTFYDGQTPLTGGQHLPLDGTGFVSFSTTALTRNSNPGHQINAIFEPTNAFGQAQDTRTQIVNGTPTSTTVTATNTSLGSVTLNVTVTALAANPNPITGTVTCYVDNQSVGYTEPVVNGMAVVTIPPQLTATHTYTCNYSGDTYYNPSGGSAVGTTTGLVSTKLTLVSGLNPTPALSPVTFTATLLDSNNKPLAGVAVSFTVDAAAPVVMTTSASGVVTLTTSFVVGPHSITASYAGDTTYASATAHLTETAFVNVTTLGLVISPNPGYQNTPINFAVTVAPTIGSAVPYGTVVLFDGITAIATLQMPAATSTGSVSTALSTLTVGDHNISATYTPADGNFLGSSTTATQTLTILPQGFTVATSAPSITIETQHHGSVTVNLTSVGDWTGFVSLSCGQLPATLKCEYKDQSLPLQPNGNASTTLTLETDAIDGFEATRGGLVAGAFLLLPLCALARKRRRAASLLLALLVAIGLGTLAGCTGRVPDHTPPGTYQILVTGTGAPLNGAASTTQTATLTVVVTP